MGTLEKQEVIKKTKLKKVHLPDVPGIVKVNEDGTEIIYGGRKVSIHLIKSGNHSRGFYACSIKGKSFYVHRIVAEAYVQNKRPVVYRWVLHKNGDTLDNHYKNLVWGNASQLYKIRTNLNIPGVGVTNFDEKYRGSSSISYEEALSIAERLDRGEYAKDISKEYGVSEMSITRIRKRYCKNKIASPRYDKTVKETVIKLAKKHSLNKVAQITGINYHTAYRWVKNAEGN